MRYKRFFMMTFCLLIAFTLFFLNINGYAAVNSENLEPDVNPKRISITRNPGETDSTQINIQTGSNPINKGDVMFVFDRTGSMGPQLEVAKTSSQDIMNEIITQLPTTWFGVASFMDYPGYYSYPGYSNTYGSAEYGDIPWELNHQPSDDLPSVSAAISNLSMGWGADEPESYTRVLYELIEVDWRPNSKKIVILFGDAPTHDLSFAGYNFGGDPGRDGIAQTADDLEFVPVVQQVRDAGITVMAVNSRPYSTYAQATFKGMSEGFSDSPGTGGTYFEMSQAHQLPDITVEAILSATQIINELSLRVTEGYDSWITTSPSSHFNVGPETTVSFDIELKVPDSVTPGFYPFLIQVIADGTILGWTYVDITVPTSNPTSDLGFRPNRDGFRFNNFNTEATWAMFRQFFGTGNVEYPNGDRIHAADAFFNEYYRTAGSGGSCDGFTSSSIINYSNLTQPNAGIFAMNRYPNLYNQTINTDIRDAITFNQAVQLGLEVNQYKTQLCNNVGYSPASMYQYTKSLIENNSPAIIGIEWKRDYWSMGIRVLEAGGGHSLLPYRFEEPDSSTAYLYVYDPNRRGDNNRRIEFDLINDTWSYRWHVPLLPDITIVGEVGDSNECNLYSRPIEHYRHQGVPFWQIRRRPLDEDIDASTLVGDSTTYQAFVVSGPANLLFTDDSGRRLGYEGENYYNEIPDASYTPIVGVMDSKRMGIYLIPSNLLYEIQLYGISEGIIDLSILSNGYMVQLYRTEIHEGTIIELDINSTGEQIKIRCIENEFLSSFLINKLLEDEDRTVRIGNLSLEPGDEIILVFDPSDTFEENDTILLTNNSDKDKIFNLSIHRSGAEGYNVFGNSNISLDGVSIAHIDLDNWSDLNEVNLFIDLNQDGTIDDHLILVNESVVGSITFEVSHTEILVGEKVDISIQVRDQFDTYIRNGQLVNISTNLGTLSASQAETSGGLVYSQLVSGNQYGIATITAQVGDVISSIEINIQPYILYLPSLNR
jgi:hypothetical protein